MGQRYHNRNYNINYYRRKWQCNNHECANRRFRILDKLMEIFFTILVEFGLPVAASTVMGFFIYLVIKYILESVVGQVNGMHGIIMGLENRVKNMNNDMIKLDIQISDALNLRQDEERISRADGKEDARRD